MAIVLRRGSGTLTQNLDCECETVTWAHFVVLVGVTGRTLVLCSSCEAHAYLDEIEDAPGAEKRIR